MILLITAIITTLVLWVFAAHYAAEEFLIRYSVFGLMTVASLCFCVYQGVGFIDL